MIVTIMCSERNSHNQYLFLAQLLLELIRTKFLTKAIAILILPEKAPNMKKCRIYAMFEHICTKNNFLLSLNWYENTNKPVPTNPIICATIKFNYLSSMIKLHGILILN